MFYVGLLISRLCSMSDIVLFIDWLYCIDLFNCIRGGLLDEWLACWTQAQMGPGSNRSRDAVG